MNSALEHKNIKRVPMDQAKDPYNPSSHQMPQEAHKRLASPAFGILKNANFALLAASP